MKLFQLQKKTQKIKKIILFKTITFSINQAMILQAKASFIIQAKFQSSTKIKLTNSKTKVYFLIKIHLKIAKKMEAHFLQIILLKISIKLITISIYEKKRKKKL